MKIIKRKSICAHTHKKRKQEWKRSVNLLIVRDIIFWRWTQADDVNWPSSYLPQDLVMRWSWNWCCCHFSSFVFSVYTFWFRSLQPLSKFWYMLTVRQGILRHSKVHVGARVLWWLAGKYDISLARYTISGESDMKTDSSCQIHVC